MVQSSENLETSPMNARNVLGQPLLPCSLNPRTGFCRDGYCQLHPEDRGIHTLCAVMDERFLAFSAAVGNDLSTPVPEYGFPGLQPGDSWCLCTLRWKQALESGFAPKVKLASTHESVLEWLELADLQRYAAD